MRRYLFGAVCLALLLGARASYAGLFTGYIISNMIKDGVININTLTEQETVKAQMFIREVLDPLFFSAKKVELPSSLTPLEPSGTPAKVTLPSVVFQNHSKEGASQGVSRENRKLIARAVDEQVVQKLATLATLQPPEQTYKPKALSSDLSLIPGGAIADLGNLSATLANQKMDTNRLMAEYATLTGKKVKLLALLGELKGEGLQESLLLHTRIDQDKIGTK